MTPVEQETFGDGEAAAPLRVKKERCRETE